MDKKKKIIIGIAFGIVVVGIAVGIFLALKNQDKQYPSKPINQTSLSSSNQDISLGTTQISQSDKYLYTVSTKISLDKVQSFVSEINTQLKQTDKEEGVIYTWTSGSDSVIYELEQNTVIFNVSKGITWNEASITGYSFSQFVAQYFGKSWEYIVSDSKKMSSGETIYYAKRRVDNTNVEMILDKQETDYLAIKNGKIVYGKLLLADFEKTVNKVPLIDETKLKRYLNVKGYPKEVYPQYGAIQSTTFPDIDFNESEEFTKIAASLSDCGSTSAEIVYMYKTMDQGLLTPVYKLNLQCSVEYQNTSYSVPAIGYVNAVDPEYISSEE